MSELEVLASILLLAILGGFLVHRRIGVGSVTIMVLFPIAPYFEGWYGFVTWGIGLIIGGAISLLLPPVPQR